MNKEEWQCFCRRIMIAVGALLLASGIVLVSVLSFSSRKALIHDIDASLSKRARKIQSLHSAISDIDDDYDFPDDMTAEEAAEYLLNTKAGYSVPEAESSIIYMDYGFVNKEQSFKAIVHYEPIYSVEEDDPVLYIPGPVIRDEDGDWFSANGGIYEIVPAGLFYSEILTQEYTGEYEIHVYGMNSESSLDTEHFNLAKEIFASEKKTGWDGENRYLCFEEELLIKNIVDYDYVYDVEYDYLSYAYLDPNRYSESQIDSMRSIGLDGGYQSYKLQTVMFSDASEELAAWRKEVTTRSLVTLGVYIVVMAALALFLRIYTKKYVKDPFQVADEQDGADADSLMAVIPESLGKELLSKIDSAEVSMGPNGYLDEMRTTIMQRTKKDEPEEHQDEGEWEETAP